MRLAFAGTPVVALPALQALIDAGHDLAAVVTRPAAPVGRGKKLVESAVAQLATELGIEVLTPGKPKDADFVARLRELDVDAIPVVAYGALLPADVLAIPKHGWINLHFSLLPAWRGAAPVQRALMNGDQETGVTTFRIVLAMDAGPIYRQVRTPFGAEETAGEALNRLAQLGAGVLVGTMADVTAGEQPVEQDSEGVSLAPKVNVDDAQVDWSRPAAQVVNLVRGTNPAPGAWSTLIGPDESRGDRLKILRARVAPDVDLAPGQLFAEKRRLLAGAGDGAVELVEVQGFGKRAMSGTDWARGAKPQQGAHLG